MAINYKNKTKKSVIFSFLALFISILAITILYFFLDNKNFEKDIPYTKIRIQVLNSELNYFENFYLKETLTYSTYNSLNFLKNKIKNDINFQNKISKNYSYLNSILKNLAIYGEFNNSFRNENKSLNFFIREFQKTNNHNNLSFEVLEFSVYEEKPFFLTVQILANLSLKTKDNFLKWNFKEHYKVDVPLFDLENPTLLKNNKEIKIRSGKFGENFNLSEFNSTIYDMKSIIYVEPTYNYKIGESFLDGLLNSSTKGIYGVLESWNFDYDEKKELLFDNSKNQKQGKFFSNSLVVLDFSKESFSNIAQSFENKNKENKSIKQLGSLEILNQSSCVNDECLKFNGVNTSLEIEMGNLDTIDENLENFSLSFWIFLENKTKNYGTIFEFGGEANNFFSIYLNQSGNLIYSFGENNVLGTSKKNFTQKNEIEENVWTNILIVISGKNITTYFNKKKEKIVSNFFKNFFQTQNKTTIGSNINGTNFFNGTLDEFLIFSKSLNNYEISKINLNKKKIDVNYVDSLHKRGIYLDGKNNYLELETELKNKEFENFSYEIWFYPHNLNEEEFLISSFDMTNTSQKFSLNLKKVNQTHFKIENNFTNTTGTTFAINSQNSFTKDKWMQIVGVYSKNNIRLFVNSKLEGEITNTGNFKLDQNIFLGTNKTNFFNGIIDEFRIYNYSLNKNEIEENFFNYKQKAKSCCSTLTLINPEHFLNLNKSYTTNLFFKENKNVSLFNLTDITKQDMFKNFVLDVCVLDAFDIFNITQNLEIVNLGFDNKSCKKLIEAGIY